MKSISFEGNGGLIGGIPDSTLRNAMEQSKSPSTWWLRPSERAEVLDTDTLTKDAWRIETWYANNGYFNSRVRGWDVITVREANPKRNRPEVVRVVGFVQQSKPSTVRELEWEGMDGLGAAIVMLLKKKAAVQKQDVFSINAVKEAEGQTLNQLHELSYGFAKVSSRVEAYPEQKAVDVFITAERGPACRFGEITIRGNYDVPEEYVMSEISIKEGGAFRASKLAETQRRLFGLGIFSVVNVIPDLSREADKIIPVTVELSESKYRQLRLGTGVSIESGKQDIHGVAEFQHVNVFNRMWNLTTSVRPGYTWIATLDDLTDEQTETQKSPTGEASVQLEIPHFPKRDWKLNNGLDVEYGIESGYEFLSPSFGPTLSWQVNEPLTLSAGYDI
ncbi:MAG: POTRA domain-containing protein, partial [Myxococcota bacterium]